MAEQTKQKVTIRYCKHCRTSSCLDKGFEFERVKERIRAGEILVRSRFERISSVAQKKPLGKILSALEKEVHIVFRDIFRCVLCRNEIRQLAGEFNKHTLYPRKKKRSDAADEVYSSLSGSLSNAVRNLEGD